QPLAPDVMDRRDLPRRQGAGKIKPCDLRAERSYEICNCQCHGCSCTWIDAPAFRPSADIRVLRSIGDQNETPLALTGPSHFLTSAARNWTRYTGERRSRATGPPPTSLRRCCKAGESSAATVARLSLCTIAGGVLAGRNNAYQLGRSKSVSPCSCAD